MSFVIKLRGALTGTKLAEYCCDEHGRFDAWVSRDDVPDEQPCPECETPSPWVIGAPTPKVSFASAAVHGGYTRPEHPMALDTRELGEGMPVNEWRKKRAKKWADRDRNDPKRREQAERAQRELHKAEGFVREKPDLKKSKVARIMEWAKGGSNK